jgi:peptide/nickel transport system substrate-binding protein
MNGHTCSSGFVIAIVACLLLPVAWAPPPTPGGTLRVADEADRTGLAPQVSFGLQARSVAGSRFNSLVTIDAALTVVPDLADSWEILEDGKVYVFHLRQGVTCHDGRAFDAEAGRWNYRRLVDPEDKAHDASYDSRIDAVAVLAAPAVRCPFIPPGPCWP